MDGVSREAAAGRHLTADVTARDVTSLPEGCGRLLASAPTAAPMGLGLVYQSVGSLGVCCLTGWLVCGPTVRERWVLSYSVAAASTLRADDA